MKDILLNIEAIIFAAEDGVSANEIKHILQDALLITINKEEVMSFIDKIQAKYEQEDYVFSLKMINNKYQFLTKETFHDVLNQLQANRDKKKFNTGQFKGKQNYKKRNWAERGWNGAYSQIRTEMTNKLHDLIVNFEEKKGKIA